MIKIKNIIVSCLFLLLIIALTGCHGGKTKNDYEIPDSFDISKEYEITFWAKNESNITQANIYKQAIDDFNKYYPNIKVNLRIYTDYSRIYNDVITNITTDTTPNVCITYPDHIATYITGSNTVVPLDELFIHDKYGLGGSEIQFDAPLLSEMVPSFLEECKIGGVQYAVPYMRSTEACYVNRDYVEKLGFTLPETLTWDFMFEVAEAAVKKDENGNFTVNGQKVMIPIIYKSTDNMMIQLLAQKNAGYSDEMGKILIFNDTTKEILYDIAKHAETGAFSTFKIAGYPANFLNAGQCIFAIDSTAGATWMGSDAPLIDISEENLVAFETAVMTVPQVNPNDPRMISQGPSICVFNKEDAGEVLASWLFVQYLLTNEVQIPYSQTEGYIPVTLKAQNSDEYKNYLSRKGEDNEQYYDVKLEAAELLINNTENTFVTPVFNGSASLRSASGQMIENVTKSVRRRETVDEEYINNLFDDMVSLYRLENVSSDELPKASFMLLFGLGAVWLLIILYSLKEMLKNRKNRKNSQ